MGGLGTLVFLLQLFSRKMGLFSLYGVNSTPAVTELFCFPLSPSPQVCFYLCLIALSVTSLSSHTAFDVDAVTEIIFVLFSATTLPLTHVSFFCMAFLMHKHISTLTSIPFCSLACSSRRRPTDGGQARGDLTAPEYQGIWRS